MTTLRVEFTVEPFSPGDPGPHVTAAVDAARIGALKPDVGPFATAVEGEVAVIADAIHAVTTAAFSAGATRVSFTLEAFRDTDEAGPGETGTGETGTGEAGARD